MLRPLSVLGIWLGATRVALAQNDSTSGLPDVLDRSAIEALGNNSLFNRWRPVSHFNAPAGWMNVSYH